MKIISRQEAIEQDLKKYFTGKPCRYKHVSERRVDNCNCIECQKKLYKEYYKERYKEYYKDYAITHKKEIKDYRDNHKEYFKDYYKKNKEHLKEYKKQWYQNKIKCQK